MMSSLKAQHVVIIKDGELLPIQKGSPCLRMGSIAKNLVERGAKVSWLATTWSHQFKTKIDKKGSYPVCDNYDVHLLECGEYTNNISVKRILHHNQYAKQSKLWFENLDVKPSLVVCAYPIPGVAASVAKYCKQHAIPFVLDVRDLWPDVFVDKLGSFGAMLASPLIKRQQRDLELTLDVATSVIAVSEKYLSWAKDHGDQETQYWHFPIGAEAIDLKKAKPKGEFAEKIASLKGKTFFSFLGSFGKSYDLDLIISAAEHFEKVGASDVCFLVAGDGEQRSLIEDADKRLGNVLYCGWLDAENTRAFLATSHVGIMPLQSVSGTFPNKPFQYMAAELPIISSLVGDFEEFVDHEKIGINFKQGDESTFIAAIEKLRDPTLRTKMSSNVSTLFHSRFEQNVIYSKLGDVLEKLVETKAAK